MSENPSEEYTRLALEGLEFTVKRIPTVSGAKRADYEVSDDASKYLVEVKGDELSQKYSEAVDKARDNGVVGLARDVKAGLHFADVIARAARQLKATPSEAGTFQVVWVSVQPAESLFSMSECKSNLFGMVPVLVAEDSGAQFATCYCYEQCDFQRHPSVDGVIIVGDRGGELCVNPFSSRLTEFRTSRLHSVFQRGLYDPGKQEPSESVFIIEGDVDRFDFDGIAQFVLERYGKRVFPAKVAVSSAVMVLKLPANDDGA